MPVRPPISDIESELSAYDCIDLVNYLNAWLRNHNQIRSVGLELASPLVNDGTNTMTKHQVIIKVDPEEKLDFMLKAAIIYEAKPLKVVFYESEGWL